MLIIKYLRVLVLLGVLFLIQSSCKKKRNYSVDILKNGIIDTNFFQKIDKYEKALLTWYLFAYGNECNPNSEKVKCELLKLLAIEDECNQEQIDFLQNSFDIEQDVLMKYKLQKCPIIPFKGAIQNTIEKIVLIRAGDKIEIIINVKGMNQMQEKTWNIEQSEHFLIKNKRLIKISTKK